MQIYIYKLAVALFLFYIFFELTIGSRIDYYKNKIEAIGDHQTRLDLKEKIKNELRKANDKENYLTEEERLLISNFIKKLKKELDLEAN